MRNLTSGPGGSPFVPRDRYGSRIRFAPPDDDGTGIEGTFEPITFKVEDSGPERRRESRSERQPEKRGGDVEVDLNDPDKDRRRTRSDVDRGDRYQRDSDIEVVTEGEEKPRGQEKPQQGKQPADGEDDDADLSERVRKRIAKATRAQRDAERRAQEAEERASRAEQHAQQSTHRAQQADGVAFATFEREVNADLQRLEREFKAAYESGDSDAVWKLQRQIASAQSKADWVEAEKRRRGAQAGQQPGQQRQPQPGQPPRQPAGQPQRAGVDPVTMKWVDDNSDWFRDDSKPANRRMTAVAYAIDAELQGEGLDPKTPEFWAEMDKRLDEAFPQYRQPAGQQAQHRGNGSPVAGPMRGSPGGRQRVVLSREELTHARALGISPERFAREKLKMENGNASFG